MSHHLTAEDWAILVALWLVIALWIADAVHTALSIGKRNSLPPKGRSEVL